MSGRDIRTLLGFSLILIGILSSLWLGWWLATEGDIIEIIHRIKVGLPGWVWMGLKVTLSAAVAVIYLMFFIITAALIFRGRQNK